jgi:hypothetical protein
MSVLLKPFKQFPQTSVKKPSCTTASEHSSDISQKAAEGRRLPTGARLRAAACGAVQKF